ncbi:DegT/DnrJ/EryC1/StrS family aminotransferase (plasmid) [Paracoccus liaowanqingii]|uniref:DegT/DnrJ/EryC1/StrS family aminotransferase n=1 Tax=Paracoccus liaowanqingii TaxID=2560053 RepID=A0A4Y5SQP0_9RHOB|nr:DegT/DnrJ/EryC1/StrS family aminotransferase [Paracoccus liaowanqingii]QDA35810.1 DegT/DnrJ/EryC1/StrS family aminotransferase [Paracoccus liaowanqingii]
MIPFLDLSAQYRVIGSEIEEAVLRTLRTGTYVLGEAVEQFERDFAAYCGTSHAVAVSSGTSALHLALLAAGVGPGDEVLTVPMTFVATVAAILYAGATPVFVDVDPDTWTMDPAKVEEALTLRTKAILPVHLHGRLPDMHALGAIARRHGLTVIEDAAQAHGAQRDGLRAGAWGNMGCFSFYPGKNLGACGEGGAVTTNDPHAADMIRSLRDWGQSGKYNHVRHGFNYRMEAVQGAVLNVKLRYLDGWNATRRSICQQYQEGLAPDLGRPEAIGDDHACHVYALRTTGRDVLQARLRDAGIATNLHYPVPVHLQPAYRGLGYREADFPVSEALARTMLSLPLFAELPVRDVDHVIATVNRLVLAEETSIPLPLLGARPYHEGALQA